MVLLKQSTSRSRMILMIDSADHITGKTGLTLTVTLSKDGAAFAAMGGSVTEISSGWYKLALNTPDTNTLGDLAIHATATGADPTDVSDQVVALLPGDNVTVGTNNDKTGYSLSQAFPTNFSSLSIDGNGRVDVVKVLGTTQTARDLGLQLDATVSSRMASYTQPTGFLTATFPSGTVANTTNITAGTITTATNLTNLPSIPANWITAAGITAAALNGKGDWNIGKTGYSLTQAFPTNFSSLSIDINGRVDVIKLAGTSQTARDLGLQLDAAISTRLASSAINLTSGKVDVGSINGAVVQGVGTSGDLWRG